MMQAPVLFANGPLLVQVVDQNEWWQPYVPPLVGLIGSLIVAAAAFAGVVKSNRTNLAAIASADTREREKWQIDSEREREKWHRDNLLRICSEAIRVSREIHHNYNEAAGACLKHSECDRAEKVFREHMAAAETAIGKVAPLSYDVQLLGESTLYMELQEIRQAGEYVAPAYAQFHEYLVSNFDRLRHNDRAPESVSELTAHELYESLEWRRYYKAGQHLGEVHVNFQFAARTRISPHSVPKDAPDRVGPVITPDKDPDLFYPPPGAPQNIYQRPSVYDWRTGDTAEAHSANNPVSPSSC
ncbi:hypothetical protein ACJH6J_22610 [Mycobacterium sp. SMC-18]|uniref:hypothetical protein n=1 Tax=Mycobacterium sp. SMC-18 TaxID=3381629 RepID=UPI003876A0C4